MEEVLNKTVLANLGGYYFYRIPYVCYQPSSITTNGVWQEENPLGYSLPLFILQLMIIVVTTQVVVIILKPLRQPKVVSEIIAGMLLSNLTNPELGALTSWFGRNIFPMKSMLVLKTMANIGLLYYLFLVGIEMDVSLVKQSSRQTLAIAIFGLLVPLFSFVSLTVMSEINYFHKKIQKVLAVIFEGMIISSTAFPVLSRILVELKLFNTELGRKAMSAALIVDLCAWILLALFVIWADILYTNKKYYPPILFSIGFVLVCVIVIRPAILWIINRTPEGENIGEFYICLILTGVMICGFITDAIGIHSVFGAFIFGLIIPNGPLGSTLLEKLEDFVTTLLLPLFFTINGIGADVSYLSFHQYDLFKFCLILSTNATKVLPIFLVGLYFDMQKHEALSLGLLMNTKGIVDLIFLNLGLEATYAKIIQEKKMIFHPVTSPIMVICMVAFTAITTPAITILYKTSRNYVSYKHMTIQKAKMVGEMKILMCIHTPRNVPAMIDLLEVSRANEVSHIHVYTLHLVELTGRASSMLIVHNAGKHGITLNAMNHLQVESKHIVRAFENYALQTTNVNVRSLTAISPYPTMHEDICNLAKDHCVTIIIIPFHKQQTVDGGMESINPAFRHINQNVLDNAPCSVGILIDRGHYGSTSHIVVIFIGGSDDREALAYGWRMAEYPGVNLFVMRFVPTDNLTEHKTNIDIEAQIDNEFIGDFRLRIADQKQFIYREKTVKNCEEIVATIRNMDSIYDLYIVGRGRGIKFPPIVGLNEFSECVRGNRRSTSIIRLCANDFHFSGATICLLKNRLEVLTK